LNVAPILPSHTIHGSEDKMRMLTVYYANFFQKQWNLLTVVTIKQVFDAVDKLNSRPRKFLDFKTPYEVFEKLTGINIRNLMGYALMT